MPKVNKFTLFIDKVVCFMLIFLLVVVFSFIIWSFYIKCLFTLLCFCLFYFHKDLHFVHFSTNPSDREIGWFRGCFSLGRRFSLGGVFHSGGHEEWKQLFYLIKLKLYLSHSPEAFLFVSGACAGFQFFFFKCKIYIVHYAGFVISRWKCTISARDCAESSFFLRKCTIYSLLCAGILFFLHKCKILI